MANTYSLIASSEVATSGQTSIQFSSIDQSYTDLILLTSLNDSGYASTNSTAYVKYNSSTTNMSGIYWIANTFGGANPGTGRPSNQYIINIPANTADSSQFSNGMYYIPNYSAAKYKTAISDSAMALSTGTTYGQAVYLWSDNTAITTITITTDGSFRAKSTAYLYGIKNS
jgi:hypothetical protein